MKTRRIFGVSLSLILINLASIMERADENLLPSVYKEVSEAFSAGPTDLGYLTFIRNFVQAISSPVAGVLVLHYVDRPRVLAMGTACWALSTAGVGASHHFTQVAFWRAVNGLGLAIVIPSLQSFIADSFEDGVRGRAFGMLSLVGSIGGIGGGVLATVMAGKDFWGFPGWRFAFVMMASLSLLIGLLVFLFVVDPGRATVYSPERGGNPERMNLVAKSALSPSSIWVDSWIAMKTVIRIPTFQVIVLQGIVGSLPWTAMVFFTMWFELIGFDHNSTAALLSLLAIGCALGSFLGGFVADRLSYMYPHSGRIMCAQFSAFMGIPFSWFLLIVIPQNVQQWDVYAITLFLMGLTISWCSTCANNPIFAEVVPSKHRTMIYAFDRAFEGSFSAFAAPAVGMLSEKIYGYNMNSASSKAGSSRDAYALSRGLFSMMTVPFGLCCLFYSLLYANYKRDRANVKIASGKGLELT